MLKITGYTARMRQLFSVVMGALESTKSKLKRQLGHSIDHTALFVYQSPLVNSYLQMDSVL